MMNKGITVNKLDIEILPWLNPKDITLGDKVSLKRKYALQNTLKTPYSVY